MIFKIPADDPTFDSLYIADLKGPYFSSSSIGLGVTLTLLGFKKNSHFHFLGWKNVFSFFDYMIVLIDAPRVLTLWW